MSRNSDTSKPTLSVVIAVRNDPRNLDLCLQAIANSVCDTFECIVINDCSDDGLTEGIIAKYSVRTEKNRQCRGPAYSRNKGARMANGGILFFIDSDVIIRPDTITKVSREFAKGQFDALIGSYDDEPGDNSFISQYKNMFHHYVHQNLAENACTFWCGCGAIRKVKFAELGGFDEAYHRPAIEDIELGIRLTLSGGRIDMCKNIQVKHLKRWTFWNMLKTDIFDRGVPWTKLLLARRTFPNTLNVSRSQRIFVSLAVLTMLSFLVFPFVSPHQNAVALFGSITFAVLILANHDFYRFFIRKKGVGFTIKVVPLHFLYFIYCGVSVGLGVLSFGKNILARKQNRNVPASSKTFRREKQKASSECPK